MAYFELLSYCVLAGFFGSALYHAAYAGLRHKEPTVKRIVDAALRSLPAPRRRVEPAYEVGYAEGVNTLLKQIENQLEEQDLK